MSTPTVRYWRDEDGMITRRAFPPLTPGTYVEVRLYSDAELDAIKAEAAASALDALADACSTYIPIPRARQWAQDFRAGDNPYRSTERED